MRVLIDECLPWRIREHLEPHDVETVHYMGWSGISNGELLRRASGNFDVFLTVDKALPEEAKIPSDLAVITIQVKTNRIESLIPLVPNIREALESIRPGSVKSIGA